MYYPYLRGKQFELLALREFADIGSGQFNIIPIIEPVKKNLNSLRIASQKMEEREIIFYLILNPIVGDLADDSELIEDFFSNDLSGLDFCWPSFIVNNLNCAYVYQKIDGMNLKSVLLVCQEDIDNENLDFLRLLEKEEVESCVINGDNRFFKRWMQRKYPEKNIIRIDDKFSPQKKNADYINISEEKFTEEHLYFTEDGFVGFADYTVLGSDFSDGGRLPYAVALHFTYEKNKDEIWIRHFVSDSNDDNTNIQGKFGEAAEKAIRFFEEKNITSGAIRELKSYYNNDQYPGLGVLKKLSIKHHLELINTILSE